MAPRGPKDPRIDPASAPPATRFHIAFSGGVDSTALLCLLRDAGLQPLSAIHVHHGLQAAADDWAAHCQQVCSALDVPLTVRRVVVDADDPAGPEAAARHARYEAFAEQIGVDEALVTAHHLDDQAETVLLRLLRGSGVDGLAAMRGLRRWRGGWLWRPLLDVTREALAAVIRHRGLKGLDDPHNRDARYLRSWLRSAVMPAMNARLPATPRVLARTARHLDDAAVLMASLADSDLGPETTPGVLDYAPLCALSDPRRRNAVRHWLSRQHVAADTAALEEIERSLLAAAEDAQPLLRLGDRELRRYRHWLCLSLVLPPPPASDAICVWRDSPRLVLPDGCGALEAEMPPPRPLTVRFAGPTTIRPAEDSATRRVKLLFQARDVPPWLRRRWPRVYLEDQVAWIPGVAETAAWRAFRQDSAWSPRHVRDAVIPWPAAPP